MPKRSAPERAAHSTVPASIKGEVLREFAASGGRRRRSVIVQTHLVLENEMAGRIDAVAVRREVAALKKDLGRLGLLERARSVSIISGFVLEVTPGQLLRLAQADSVKSVWPNLWHRLVRPPAGFGK